MTVITGTIGADTLSGTSSDDEVYGLDGNDILNGDAGNDLIVGGDGNDTLDGGTGYDVLEGGAGNDVYYIDEPGDSIVEAAATGDTDIAYIYSDYFSVGASAHVEQLIYLGTGWATLIGSDSNNLLQTGTGHDWLEGLGGNDFLFSGAGNDYIEGGDGNDELDGWLGNDTMIGGLGDDIYNVDSASDVVTEYAGEGTDTVKVRKSTYTLPTHFENADLRYYSGSISVTGNSANNVFVMGVGAQSVAGSTGVDTVSYAHTGAVAIDLWTSTFGGEAADDWFTGIENLTGSAYDDELRALGTVSVLDGGAGADVMEGRAGGDVYYVDNAGDTVIEIAGGGTDEVRVRTLSSYTLPGYVEKLTNWTGHSFTGTGNAIANEINGGASFDYLYGGAGNDTLNGGDGDDQLHGEGDHDVLNGGAGNDSLHGGLGNDTFHVDCAGDSVTELIGEGTDQVLTSLTTYVLGDHVENLTYTGGGSGPLDYTGSNVGNILNGGAGDDLLDGLGGADELYGHGGGDVLDGGSGDDLILGGAGADVLTGGSGGDLFRFSDGETGTGTGADRIADFAFVVDKIDLRGIDADTGTAGDQAFTFIGTAAFSGTAGELRLGFDGTDTWIQGDVDGDGAADVEIVFTGSVTILGTDFYL